MDNKQITIKIQNDHAYICPVLRSNCRKVEPNEICEYCIKVPKESFDWQMYMGLLVQKFVDLHTTYTLPIKVFPSKENLKEMCRLLGIEPPTILDKYDETDGTIKE